MLVAARFSWENMLQFNDKLLKIPASSKVRDALIARLWSLPVDLKIEEADCDENAYLAYYLRQCKHAIHDEEHMVITTQAEMIEIAEQIVRGDPRTDIESRLRMKHADDGDEMEVDRAVRLDNSIDLVVRLTSMMSISGAPCCGYLGRRPIQWERGSLKDFVKEYFNSPVELGYSVKLGVWFNARNLKKLGRMHIDWTSNLMDHLRFVDDGKKRVVFVFHHASFLNCQQRYVCLLVSVTVDLSD